MTGRQKQLFNDKPVMQRAVETHNRMAEAGHTDMVVILCDLHDPWGREMCKTNTDPDAHADCDVWFFGLKRSGWNAQHPHNRVEATMQMPVVIISGPFPVIVECMEVEGMTAPASVTVAGTHSEIREAFGAGKTHSLMN